MLEKPDLDDQQLIACLQQTYALDMTQLSFLALGADFNAAVYRARASDDREYFVKLRSGRFDETALSLPSFLHAHGAAYIIAPLQTQTGAFWTTLEGFVVIVYPFVEGQNAYQLDLSRHQWGEFGIALKQLHTAHVPMPILHALPQESYDPKWYSMLSDIMHDLDQMPLPDQIAVDLADFLRTKETQILAMIKRAELLSQALQADAPDFVVCHSDIHAGNLLIDQRGHVYIVDWDNPILAPKERDLMFIGGGQGFIGYTAEEEQHYFYLGYGRTDINSTALAYYRYIRIIEDLVLYCEQIFLARDSYAERQQSFQYVKTNFQPGGTLERAAAADSV